MKALSLNLLVLSQPNNPGLPFILKDFPGQVVWQPDLERALKDGSALQPDIVIWDLDENPMELEGASLETYFPFAKWIAFSSEDSAKTAALTIRQGFSDYLLKPVSEEDLFKALVACQRQQKMHLELAVTHLHRVEQMKKQTYIDDLTGLYNARYLQQALEQMVLEHTQQKKVFSVLFIDVDKFKTINDTYGHLVGSQFLSALGKTLKNALRAKDLVFRYGGDEFVVLLGQTPQERAFEVADRLRLKIEKRIFVLDGISVRATLSIGIACFPAHGSTVQDLLKLADYAMYSAKRISRNTVEVAQTVSLLGV